ncbi:hypothetical protein M407DRAFT_241056 [Tulasnella calospora MUT 4182]|uniref:Uncharacterized protein n=1 Tax=Tulasnella calospora MUT 4182 TaxID=1051891 RepID=A0A0C3LHL2_9AGAM|nr:hypothetical protein M407DRAFT_241056 [Tulasnella calospora MUT 4182]
MELPCVVAVSPLTACGGSTRRWVNGPLRVVESPNPSNKSAPVEEVQTQISRAMRSPEQAESHSADL